MGGPSAGAEGRGKGAPPRAAALHWWESAAIGARRRIARPGQQTGDVSDAWPNLQVGAVQVGAVQVGAVQVGAVQVGAVHVGAVQCVRTLGGPGCMLWSAEPPCCGSPMHVQSGFVHDK